MRIKIDWASLIVGSKFTVFALFYFVLKGNFPSTSPQVAYIWRGDSSEGFLRNRFTQYLEWLIHGGAYFRNFTVAKCCVAYKLIKGEVPLYIEDSLRLKSQQPSRVTGLSVVI